MKKLLPILFLLLFVTTASAQMGWSSGNWNQTECAICGSRIYYWVEGGITFHGDTIGMSGMFPPPEYDREAYKVGFDKTLYVDEYCYDKYREDLDEYMKEMFWAWVTVKRRREKVRRTEQEKLNKDKKEKELKGEIKALKLRLKELEK